MNRFSDIANAQQQERQASAAEEDEWFQKEQAFEKLMVDFIDNDFAQMMREYIRALRAAGGPDIRVIDWRHPESRSLVNAYYAGSGRKYGGYFREGVRNNGLGDDLHSRLRDDAGVLSVSWFVDDSLGFYTWLVPEGDRDPSSARRTPFTDQTVFEQMPFILRESSDRLGMPNIVTYFSQLVGLGGKDLTWFYMKMDSPEQIRQEFEKRAEAELARYL
jgi:hypothetical protein